MIPRIFKNSHLILVLGIGILSWVDCPYNLDSCSDQALAEDQTPEPPQNQLIPVKKLDTKQTGNEVNKRVKVLGGTIILDGGVQVTKSLQENQYIEFVGISTPTAPSQASHTRVWFSSGTSQVCAEFNNGSTTCFGPSGGGTITGVTAGLGLNGGGTAGTVTVGLSTPIANSSIDGSSITKQGPIVSSISVNSVYPGAVQPGTYNIAVSSAAFLSQLVSLSTGVTGSLPAASIAAGSLGTSVIASSIAANTVYPLGVQAGTYSNITLPAANVASGSLGSSVICSSNSNSQTISSMTVTNLQTTTLKFADGTTQTSAASGFATLTGTQTWSGTNTFAGSTTIKGTTTNDNAAVGYYGEYISSSTSGGELFPTSNQYGDLVSVSLTAGDWDINITETSTANGATVTEVLIGASTTSGNSGSGLTSGDTISNAGIPTSSVDASGAIPEMRFSLNTTTTIYFKYRATYSAATPKMNGRISARRAR